MDPHYHTFGNSIRGRMVHIRSSRSDSIGYYRHGIDGDNKSYVGIFEKR